MHEDVYCPKEETFGFLEDVLDEVMQLFPGRYIHIGGDEAPKSAWKKCPDCRARIRDEGLKDEFEIEAELHLADDNQWRLAAPQRDEIAAADFTLDRQVDQFQIIYERLLERKGGRS